MQISLTDIEQTLRRDLPRLEREFRVSSLALFGSRARQQQRADSDLDILVSFHRLPGLFQFIELEQHLSDLLGLQVDLVLRESLKPAVRERVLADLVEV
jgi:predicted nucleotidyltransferase